MALVALAAIALTGCAAELAATPSVTVAATATATAELATATPRPSPRPTSTLTPDQEIQRIFTHSDSPLPVSVEEFLAAYNLQAEGAFIDEFDVEAVGDIEFYEWTQPEHGIVVGGFSHPDGQLRMMSAGYRPDPDKDAVGRPLGLSPLLRG